jgi:phosphatidylglycerophosphate synthase
MTENRSKTIEEIKKVGQPKDYLSTHSLYSVLVLRKISPYFTKFFVQLGVSANQVSAIGILFGIIAGFMLSFGNLLMFLSIAFYQLWNIFDCVDGEVARVTNNFTIGGRFLEEIDWVTVECAFLSFLGIGLYRMLGSMVFVFLGLAFALFLSLLTAYAKTRDSLSKEIGVKEKYSPFTKMSPIKRMYMQLRNLFLITSAHLILIILLIYEFSPISIRFSIFKTDLNLLALYFFAYGVVWSVRAVTSIETNYRFLMRKAKGD